MVLTIQMKGTEQYYSVVLYAYLAVQCAETLKCDNSN